ncbi:hypothetical protein [Pseudomonas endophytica]|uniref:hypothetical protein n=1 Tax=Pseudomonas endophytica TaxID=1563157 RepID=UPI0012E22962|nr:hypothetical protein [Pseudomonas endophytica]
MKFKMTSLVLASTALITCSNAWAWYMSGETVRFNAAESNLCQQGGLDAAAIMYSRQMGKPLSYPSDEYSAPSASQKEIRVKFLQLAETYPIESTEDKKMAVADKFSRDMRAGCLQYIKVSRPQSFAE